ncbi:hypothetical protein BEP19_05870 [Ammoniphilus oxalaticus]|uniref:Penicillin-binding protein n=1 Tax=Ammoniphilus oxalaticus TaxID=66863 RepID=A0A419SJ27_9BACL|nr:penicillin-binding transpeptidase domain-containing protein [Ammoniphilus oxalaticus]RKD23949.1 hypothetical protein BEP19_05870 [Ammoniphilus oxalaticus]
MSKPIKNAIKRRIVLILFSFVLLWGGLISRLFWIQVVDVKQFSKHRINLIEEAVSQRKQAIVLHTGRGDIKDRDGVSLTGSEVVGVAVFPLVRGYLEEQKVSELAKMLSMDPNTLLKFMEKVKEPTFLRDFPGKVIALSEAEVKRVEALKLPGVLALPITERYQTDGIANHLIGYISQNPDWIAKHYAAELKSGEMSRKSLVGASGLERSFDRFLQGVGPTTVSYFVDGKGNPLNGLKSRLIQQDNQFYPLSLITTIDRELQQKVEQWMEEQQIEQGAAVVLDAKTREVLAMTSLPAFHPSQIDLEQGNWVNHALKQTAPGSIFKTVLAGALLEEGLVTPEEKFHCEGEYGKYGFSCWKDGGHGQLTFSEAYAESCNIAFAEATSRLSPEKIEEYSKKMGLTQEVGWQQQPFYKMDSFKQFSGENRGQIFASGTDKNDEGVLIQTAIGQRDTQMTPLQAANMVATIVNGGQLESVRAVKEIRYKTGSLFHSFAAKQIEGERIDSYTAYQLQKMMERVVQEGTGQALLDAKWKLGGKTGTAQINEGKNNQWFIGYGPVEDPQYVVAVVAEREKKNASNKVIPIFKNIMDELAENREQKKEGSE